MEKPRESTIVLYDHEMLNALDIPLDAVNARGNFFSFFCKSNDILISSVYSDTSKRIANKSTFSKRKGKRSR